MMMMMLLLLLLLSLFQMLLLALQVATYYYHTIYSTPDQLSYCHMTRLPLWRYKILVLLVGQDVILIYGLYHTPLICNKKQRPPLLKMKCRCYFSLMILYCLYFHYYFYYHYYCYYYCYCCCCEDRLHSY